MKSWLVGILGAAALMLGAAWLANHAAETVAAMVTDAAAIARAERDAYWSAEIAKSNTEIAEMRLSNLEQVVAIDAAASDRIAEAERQAMTDRKDSDALPDDLECGLSAGRVELLNR